MARPPSRPGRRVPRARFPLRSRFTRAAVPYWIGVAVVAGVTAMTVAGLVDRAAEAEARFGRTRPVVVARQSLVPGDEAGRQTMTIAHWPSSLVPTGALTRIPTERVVTAGIADGEVVVAGRVSGLGASGAAGLVPPGYRAFAVPLLVPGLPVRPGDRVDVYVSAGGGDPGDLPIADGGGDSPIGAGARVVAEDAVVIDVGEQSVTVAVSEFEAPRLAAAVPSGAVIVALAGPPG